MFLRKSSTKGLGFGWLQKKAPKALNSLDAKLKSAPAFPHPNARAVTSDWGVPSGRSPRSFGDAGASIRLMPAFLAENPQTDGARKFSCLQGFENSRNVEIVALAPLLEARCGPRRAGNNGRIRPKS